MSIKFIPEYADMEFKMEEYFPLIIQFNPFYDIPRHMGFYFEDTELLEFAVDKDTLLLKEVVLVICQRYTVNRDKLEFPNTPCENGTLMMDIPSRTECDFFSVVVFSNGVKISLSKNPPQTYFQMGNVVFGFDEKDNIVELLCWPPKKELSHCKKELDIMHIS